PLASHYLARPLLTPHLHSFPTRRSSDLHGELRRPLLQEAHHALLRIGTAAALEDATGVRPVGLHRVRRAEHPPQHLAGECHAHRDRKSTRLNSSHVKISYAVFCLKKKKY